MVLKILCWNIWYDGNLKLVNDFLEQSEADIIGLQEVMRIGKSLQLSKNLIKSLGYSLLYGPVFSMQRWGRTVEVGNAILSRYPIRSSKIHNLSKTDNRLAVEATIQVGDTVLHVFTTHLLHTHQQPSKKQEEQAKNITSILLKENTILMGDFNALPGSATIKKINRVLKNIDDNLLPTWSVYREGCKKCLPQGVIYKLDNIFTTPDLKTQSYRVEESKASDHLPISVQIEL